MDLSVLSSKMAAEHSKDYLSLAQPNTPALQANNANIHSPIDNFARFKETGVFFQIVGMDPCLILLSAPLKWIARVKQSFAKCMEQMANVPLGLKFYDACTQIFSTLCERCRLQEKYASKFPIPCRIVDYSLELHSELGAFCAW